MQNNSTAIKRKAVRTYGIHMFAPEEHGAK